MIKNLACVIACLLFVSCVSTWDRSNKLGTSELHYRTEVTKISFGSCSNPARHARSKGASHALLDTVIDQQPDIFIFLGDSIYGDTEDMTVLRKKYQKLEELESFRKLRDKSIMLATWDDHDFGVNDGGNTYPKRAESEQIFLDFFKDSLDAPRRQRPGVYGAYTFGKPGKRCQIILLDTRYFRDPLPRIPRNRAPKKKGVMGWYEPTKDTGKTLLGEAQWQWLDEQLQVPADVRIIASSIQVLAVEKGMENWGNVPHEQQRLFDLLKKHDVQHTLAISGDVHYTELSKKDIGGYPFYDLTSSGISHTNEGWAKAPNSFRVGDSSFEKNAGMIEIDWRKKTIRLSSFNVAGTPLIQLAIPFEELTFKK